MVDFLAGTNGKFLFSIKKEIVNYFLGCLVKLKPAVEVSLATPNARPVNDVAALRIILL